MIEVQKCMYLQVAPCTTGLHISLGKREAQSFMLDNTTLWYKFACVGLQCAPIRQAGAYLGFKSLIDRRHSHLY